MRYSCDSFKSNFGTIDTCKNFGGHIGTFQLTDDMLDYSGTEREIGKRLGDDLREGKATLPLIRLMSTGDKNTTSLLKGTILEPDGAPFDQIVCLIKGLMPLITPKKGARECDSAKACLERFKENNAKKN